MISKTIWVVPVGIVGIGAVIKTKVDLDDTENLLSRIRQWLGTHESKFYQFKEIDQDTDEIEELVLEILDKTNEQLLLSTELRPQFYDRNDVKSRIKAIADRAHDGSTTEPSIHILLDHSVDVEDRRSQMPWIFETENIEIRKATKHVPHWMISDKRDLRIEKLHEPGVRGTPNLIILDAKPEISEIFFDKYMSWWRQHSKYI